MIKENKTYTLSCDGCGLQFMTSAGLYEFSSVERAELHAREIYGWSLDGERHYCPRCRKNVTKPNSHIAP